MLSMSVSVDVPNLADGVRFYTEAFGFSKVAAPVRGVAVLRVGDNELELCLLEKAPGTRPASGAQDQRHYDRHWTPVHLDFHVDDLDEALTRAIAAGAKQEQRHDHPEHGSVAFCSDPFGHGFCLIQRRKQA
jgi:catechol 2,3-dioxygenase-like lactoylglutathione lyase family enzyme